MADSDSSSDEEEMFMMMLIMRQRKRRKEQKKNRKKRFWVRRIFKRRNQLGEYHQLLTTILPAMYLMQRHDNFYRSCCDAPCL